MTEETKIAPGDFLLIPTFGIGVCVGLFVALFFIPKTQEHEVKLQGLSNDVHELKMSLAGSRNRIEAQDYHLKWHDAKLINHRERIASLEWSIEDDEPEPEAEPLKFGMK